MSQVSRPSQPQPKADEPLPPVLFTSAEHKKQLESRNVLLQFDEVLRIVNQYPADSRGVLQLTPNLLCQLHKFAIQDIYRCAGQFRTGEVRIQGTLHEPPPPNQITFLVQDMCDVANRRVDWSPIRTAAFLLWRLNWVHPFAGGNGRTSRAVSYFALCIRMGFILPGSTSIPEQITQHRQRYYDALDESDSAAKEMKLDLSRMETLLQGLLAKQLMSVANAEAHGELLSEIGRVASTPPANL